MRDRTCGYTGDSLTGGYWRHRLLEEPACGGCLDRWAATSAIRRAKLGRWDKTYPIRCEWCAGDVMVTKRRARFCSQVCAKASQAESHRQRRLPVPHPKPDLLTWLPAKHPARKPPKRREDWWQILVYGPCQHCGEAFTALAATYETRSLYCSERCQRSNGRAVRRARMRGAYVEPVVRLRIFERDRWRCQLCRRKVLRSEVVPHPRAATIDHIVPLAAGGSHEPANVQTACFGCNSRKGAGAADDQLRLIG